MHKDNFLEAEEKYIRQLSQKQSDPSTEPERRWLNVLGGG